MRPRRAPAKPFGTPVPRILGAGVSVVALTLLATTCKLSELVNPAEPGTVTGLPAVVMDSAPAGSTAPRAISVPILSSSDAPVNWSASVVGSSAWLSLAPSHGSTPDTMVVAMLPFGLAPGTYRDTVVVMPDVPAAAPLRMPVEFQVVSCSVRDVTPSVVVQDTLSAADCGAPGRSASFAQLYRFSATAGDSISARMHSGFDGYLILDTVPGRPPLAERDDCPGQAGTNPCFSYVLLPRTGQYVIEATSAGGGATGAFVLDLLLPRPPSAPDTLLQMDSTRLAVLVGGAVTTPSVLLQGSLNDPDGDTVLLQVEVQRVGVTFTGTPTAVSPPVASGSNTRATVSGLLDDSLYHWRARSIDRTGRTSAWASFGGNAESVADFHVSIPQAPAAPGGLIQLHADGVTTIATGGITDEATVLFQATLTDPDPGDQLRLEIEVRPVGTAFTNVATASSTPVASGSVGTATLAGVTDNVAYHWQARTVDQTGRASAWSSFGGNAETVADFRVALAPVRLAVTAQPDTTVAGDHIGPVSVAAQDGNGNTITSFTGTISITIGANPAGGVLSG